ncbi:hypothetical protein BJV78DRAFT_8286 [Lactifluus subvellereus]|nr:hypothetical protein BJV78DRAFT_8286 [Lactifluus subvellereus]
MTQTTTSSICRARTIDYNHSLLCDHSLPCNHGLLCNHNYLVNSSSAFHGILKPDSFHGLGTILDRVIRVARSLYRCHLACEDAFPSSTKSAEWATAVWNDACARTATYPCPSSQPELFAVSSMHLLSEMKRNIMHAVETSYGFDTSKAPHSIGNNANLAHTMLTRMTFIYRDYNHGGTPHLPYRHPIIQKAINIIWFGDQDADGIVFHEYFSTMPIPAIALVLTMIECCIGEWSQGIRRQSSWDHEHFLNTYRSHINSLTAFSRHPHSQGQLEQIQKDLIKHARQHAGTTPDPVTALGRFSPEDLDARVPVNPDIVSSALLLCCSPRCISFSLISGTYFVRFTVVLSACMICL